VLRFDHDERIQPGQADHFDIDEVAGQRSGALGTRELRPGGPPRRGAGPRQLDSLRRGEDSLDQADHQPRRPEVSPTPSSHGAAGGPPSGAAVRPRCHRHNVLIQRAAATVGRLLVPRDTCSRPTPAWPSRWSATVCRSWPSSRRLRAPRCSPSAQGTSAWSLGRVRPAVFAAFDQADRVATAAQARGCGSISDDGVADIGP
jgi:hypothetical protein